VSNRLSACCRLCVSVSLWLISSAQAEPLPGTKALEGTDDLAMKMVAGIDAYLHRELAAAPEKRKALWKPDFSSPEAYAKSVEPNRQRLKKILGIVDERNRFDDIEYVGGPNTLSLVAETDAYKVHAIRWRVFDGVDGEGLLLEPKGKIIAQVVAIPDADWTPEMLVGLAPGVPKESQLARRLAENGCRVVVPVLIDRKDDFSGSAKFNRWTNQPHREFVYRMAYEMGRHIIGYEVQKVLAVVDWFTKEGRTPVGVFGYGEGGLLALDAGALDTRISVTAVSGNVGPRDTVWDEPIYRNVWAQLTEFDDSDVARLIAPRALIVERSKGPVVAGPPRPHDGRGGAAPGRLTALNTAPLDDADPRTFATFDRIFKSYRVDPDHKAKSLFLPVVTAGAPGEPLTLRTFHSLLATGVAVEAGSKLPTDFPDGTTPTDTRAGFDSTVRQKRQFNQLVAFTQKVWRDSESTRDQRFAKVDFSSPEKYEQSIEPIRQFFHEEVVGKLPDTSLPMNPKTRELYDTPKWKGYEVTLDLYPDVFAYGILLLPKDLKEGEKRPVVVCQHGLEGRPQDVCNPKERTKYYNSFGAQLADLGYIVYAPQNPYIGQDKFRVLQRKANPLKLSLFSFIIRQHERTLDWLATLPNIDDKNVAFYGLSYGGKTAMRVPAILPKYCLSICSGDFNEWIGKNVSVDYRGSYMWSGEYEMPEFDLGMTFNYAEMAYLISPRPFMVERGHDDGVGIDEMVAYEYAKVRYHYAKLKLSERTEIEFFPGGHEIHGQGTFAFLKKQMGYPK
jgi:dienelactone hydrolase